MAKVASISGRMIRRIDVITACGRWLALIPVLVTALLTPSSDLELGLWPVLIATLSMAALDAVPAIMLRFRFFPNWAAYVFAILDSLFSLSLLFLGGPGMFFYCFVPVVTMSVRFEWPIGLIDAIALAVGHIVIVFIRAGFGDILRVLVSVFCHAVALVLVSILGGLLAENIKREPPLNADEVRAREQELERWRAAADRSHAIYEMASTLSATLNPERILDAVLEISTVGFDELSEQGISFGERPASAVFLFGQEGLYIAASRGIGYEEVDLAVRGAEGVLGEVLGSGEATVLGTLAEDPELSQFTPFRRCHSAICVPLRAGFEIYGAVLFASPKPDAFGQEHVELLNAVSNQAAVALTNAHLFQDLQREKEHIVSVEEEARTKLARNLHDGPTQSVSAIAMRLNYVRLLLGREPERVKEELFRLENLARHTTREIRTLLFTLRPLVLETQGLKAAVEQLAERLTEMSDLTVDLEIEEIEGQLDASTQAVAWFIVEESLTNVRKHADAKSASVRMCIRDGCLVAEIEDDGKGFDVEATMANYDQRTSYGLLGLQERAALVNGRMTIESKPGQGTKVTLVAPLSREAD